MNEDEGIHPERNRSSYERSIVRSGEPRGSIRSGTRTRGNENEGETYWVRTGSELAGVVSEWVLTKLREGRVMGQKRLESCLRFDPESLTLILSLINSINFHSQIPPNPCCTDPPKVYSMGLVSLIPMMCVFLLFFYFCLSPTNPHSFLSLLYLIYQTHLVTVVYFSHFSDIFLHSLFSFSRYFHYVLHIFSSVPLVLSMANPFI